MLLRNRRWRFHACSLRNDVVAAVLGFGALFLLAGSLYLCHKKGRAKQTAYLLIASTGSFAGAIMATMLNIHRINVHKSGAKIDALMDSWIRAEPGWSMLTAIFGTVIMITCAYLYMVTSKRDHTRLQTMRRRRLMQTAMMSSCRQEVALAIRAKMTVI